MLPMGFCNATACLQTWHRRLALNDGAGGAPAVGGHAGLDRSEELRRMRPHPWRRWQGARRLWHCYLDDFSEIVVASRRHASVLAGRPGRSQSQIRALYEARDVPRSEDKAIVMESRADLLGYRLDGRTRWLAVPCNKSLETVCLGLELREARSSAASPDLWWEIRTELADLPLALVLAFRVLHGR